MLSIMPRRRHNNNNNRVIQRTTSETIRIGELDVNHRPSNLPPPHAKKTVSSASFVVTGVSARADSITCESPDDSEEFSRQTDIETPSFSEDTSYSQYTEDVDYCACDEIILKRCVNAVMNGNEEVLVQNPLKEPPSPIKIITTSSSTTHIPSPGRFIGRFQVVKVESIHPFRRGRWICHDYVDNSEYAPRDGYEFYSGRFIKRKELECIKKKMEEETFIFQPILESDQNVQTLPQPVTIVHDTATQLVFMNAPVLSTSYHPIIRSGNTAVQSFSTEKLISATPMPLLRTVSETGCCRRY